MKKVLTYLFLIGFLASCKTSDRFAIHKRKYNKGFYIEKTSVALKTNPASSNKKSLLATNLPTGKKSLSNNTITASSTTHRNSLPVKKIIYPTQKATFVQLQHKHTTQEIALTFSNEKQVNSNQNKVSQNLIRMDFISFLQGFFLTLLILILLGCLGFGIYFVVLAADANSVLLGIKLLSIALSLLTTVVIVLFRY